MSALIESLAFVLQAFLLLRRLQSGTQLLQKDLMSMVSYDFNKSINRPWVIQWLDAKRNCYALWLLDSVTPSDWDVYFLIYSTESWTLNWMPKRLWKEWQVSLVAILLFWYELLKALNEQWICTVESTRKSQRNKHLQKHLLAIMFGLLELKSKGLD